MNGKVQQCEECKNEYASVLQVHNNHKNEFYSQTMPQVFQVSQQLHKLDKCYNKSPDTLVSLTTRNNIN